jgi:hypothetical protein
MSAAKAIVTCLVLSVACRAVALADEVPLPVAERSAAKQEIPVALPFVIQGYRLLEQHVPSTGSTYRVYFPPVRTTGRIVLETPFEEGCGDALRYRSATLGYAAGQKKTTATSASLEGESEVDPNASARVLKAAPGQAVYVSVAVESVKGRSLRPGCVVNTYLELRP